MDKNMKKELDNTFGLIGRVQKAFDRYDQQKHQRSNQDNQEMYFCGQCGMQSLTSPCVHHPGGKK